MFMHAPRRSSSSATDCIDIAELPSLHRAAYFKDATTLKELLGMEESQNDLQDKAGRTPLHYGCLTGSAEVVDILLNQFPDMHMTTDNSGYSPIYLAIQHGHLDCIKLLTKRSTKSEEKEGESPLLAAIYENQQEISEFLIEEANVNVGERDDSEITPLHAAVSNGMARIAKLLIEHGADVNAQDCHGRTPLILAAIVGAEDCVDHLIENGAKIGIKDGRDMAAKDWALRKSFQSIYSKLVLALKDQDPVPGSTNTTSQEYKKVSASLDFSEQNCPSGKCDLTMAESDATCSSSDHDSKGYQATEGMLFRECGTEMKDNKRMFNYQMFSESLQPLLPEQSEASFILKDSSKGISSKEESGTLSISQPQYMIAEDTKSEQLASISRVQFLDKLDIIEAISEVDSRTCNQNLLPSIHKDGVKMLPYRSDVEDTSNSRKGEPAIDKPQSIVGLDNAEVLESQGLQEKELLQDDSFESVSSLSMEVYDTDEDEFPSGHVTPVSQDIQSSESEEYTVGVERISERFLLSKSGAEDFQHDYASKADIDQSPEQRIQCSPLQNRDDECQIQNTDLIDSTQEMQLIYEDRYFGDADTRWSVQHAYAGDNFGVRRTTSNLEMHKEKVEHEVMVAAIENEKFLELSRQRVAELERRLQKERQVAVIKDSKIKVLRSMYRSLAMINGDKRNKIEDVHSYKQEDAVNGGVHCERQEKSDDLLLESRQELDHVKRSFMKMQRELEKKIKELTFSNDYYEDQVMKLNDECIQQRNEISMLQEQNRTMNLMVEGDTNKACADNENAAQPCQNGRLYGSNTQLCCQKVLDETKSNTLRVQPEGNLLHSTVSQHGIRSISRFSSLAQTTDSLIIARQKSIMKTAEELKEKCIEKNTLMQDELNQVKYELKMEKEKNRRRSLHEELKDGFIAYCEKLQQELTGMKEDCDTDDDNAGGGNEPCTERDGKLVKMKLNGKSMTDFKLWVEEQSRNIQLLKELILEAKEKQNECVKLFTDANNQTEMYDELVGSKLNMKEALTKSYENITSLEVRFSILQMDNDKALMILNAKDGDTPVQDKSNCSSDSRRYLDIYSDIEFDSEKSDYKNCAGNSKELFEMGQMRMGENANGKLEMPTVNIKELLATIDTLNAEKEELALEIVELRCKNLAASCQNDSKISNPNENEKPMNDRSHVFLSSDINSHELARASAFDKENEDGVKGDIYPIKIPKQVQTGSGIMSESNSQEETPTIEISQIGQTSISVKGRAKFLEKWSNCLNEEILRLQSELQAVGSERDLMEEKFNRKMNHCYKLQNEIRKLKELSTTCVEGEEGMLPSDDSASVSIRSESSLKIATAELVQLRSSYEMLQSRAQQWNNTLNEKIHRLQDYLKEVNCANGVLKSENKQLKIMIERPNGSSAQADGVGKEFESGKKKEEEMQNSRVSEAESKLLELARDVSDAKDELSRANQYFSALTVQNTENEELKEKLSLIGDINSKTLAENYKLLSENAKLNNAIEEIKEEVLFLTEKNQKLEDTLKDIPDAAKSLQDLKDDISVLQNDSNNYAPEDHNVQRASEKLARENTKLKQESENYTLRYEKECEILVQENNANGNVDAPFLAKLEELQEQCMTLESMLEENGLLRAALCEERDKMAACLQGAKCQRLELEKIQKEHQHVKKHCAAVQKKNEALEEEIRAALELKKQQALYIIELENEVETILNEPKKLKSNRSSLEKEESIVVSEESRTEDHQGGAIADAKLKGGEDFQGTVQEISLLVQQKLSEGTDYINESFREILGYDKKGALNMSNVDMCHIRNKAEGNFNGNEIISKKIASKEERMTEKSRSIDKVILKKVIATLFDEIERLHSKLKAAEQALKENERVQEKPDLAVDENTEVMPTDTNSMMKERQIEELKRKNNELVSHIEILSAREKDNSSILKQFSSLTAESANLRKLQRELYSKEMETTNIELKMLKIKEEADEARKESTHLRERLEESRANAAQFGDILQGIYSNLIRRIVHDDSFVFQNLKEFAKKEALLDTDESRYYKLKEMLEKVFSQGKEQEKEMEAMGKKVADFDKLKEELNYTKAENAKLKANKPTVNEMECASLQRHSEIERAKECDLIRKELECVRKRCHVLENCESELKEIRLFVWERLIKDQENENLCSAIHLSTSDQTSVSSGDSNLKNAIGAVFNEIFKLRTALSMAEDRCKDYDELRDALNQNLKEIVEMESTEIKLRCKEEECSNLKKQLFEVDRDAEEAKQELKVLQKQLNEYLALNGEVAELQRFIKMKLAENKELLKKTKIEAECIDLKAVIDMLFDENQRLTFKVTVMEEKHENILALKEKLNAAIFENVKLKERVDETILHKDQCLSLEKTVSATTNDCNRMRDELNRMKEKIKENEELHEENKSLSRECNSYIIQNRVLENDSYVLLGRNAQLKQMLKMASGVMERLIEDVLQSENQKMEWKEQATVFETCKAQKEHLTKEYESLQEELETCNDDISRKSHEIVIFTNEVKRMNSLLQEKDEDAAKSIAECNKKIEWLSGEKTMMDLACEKQSKLIDKLKKKNSNLEKDLVLWRSRVEDVKKQNAEVRACLEHEIKRSNGIKAKNENLAKNYEDAKIKLRAYEENSVSTKRELDTAAAILKKLANERKTINCNMEAYAARVEHLQGELKDYQAEVSELGEENFQLKADLNLLHDEIKELTFQNGSCPFGKERLVETEIPVRKPVKECEKAEAECEVAINTGLTKMQNELKEVQEKLDRSEQERHQVVDENEILKFEIEELEKRLEAQEFEATVMQTRSSKFLKKLEYPEKSLENTNYTDECLMNQHEKKEQNTQTTLAEDTAQKSTTLVASLRDLHRSQKGLQGSQRVLMHSEASLRIKALEKDIEEQGKAMSEKEEEYFELKSCYNQLKEKKREMEQQFSLSNMSLERYQTKLKESEAINKSLGAKVEHLSTTVEHLQDSNTEISQLYSESLRENEVLKQFAGLMETKLTESQEQHKDLSAKYRDARRELKRLEWNQAREPVLQSKCQTSSNPKPLPVDSNHGSIPDQALSHNAGGKGLAKTPKIETKTELRRYINIS